MTKSFVLLGVILVLDIVLAVNCGMMRQTLGLAKAVAGFSLLLALIALFTTPQGTLLVKERETSVSKTLVSRLNWRSFDCGAWRHLRSG